MFTGDMLSIPTLIIALASVVASLLTLISGFGLGTLMLPVFALFFPLPQAIAMTAVVHLLNNVFKFWLLRGSVDRRMVLRFGVPSILGAFAGAYLLRWLEGGDGLFMGVNGPVGALELAIGLLMILFACIELFPVFDRYTGLQGYELLGGTLSGFFGGLSGHQGALRSLFLLHSGLGKEAYIATGIAIALLVDLTRIPVYMAGWHSDMLGPEWPVLTLAVLCAFLGAYVGKRLIPKVTFRVVRLLVGAFLLGIGAAMAMGLLA